MAEANASGDVLVIDADAGICSDPLHCEDRDAPLDSYELGDELGVYDPAEWQVLRSGEYTASGEFREFRELDENEGG